MHALLVTHPWDHMERIQDSKDFYLDGTCSWISNNSCYREWRNSERSELLWIHGDPGKGKTMLLISQVLELKSAIERSRDAQSSLAFFFCDDKDEGLKNAVSVLRNLLYQLLCQCPEYVNCFRDEYEKLRNQLFSSSNAQQSLWRILEMVLDQSIGRTTWLLIDALDESDSESREILLRRLRSRIDRLNCGQGSSRPTKEKWLVTSRNEPRIKEAMGGSLDISLELNVSSVAEDVRRFINAKVEDLAKKKLYNKDQKKEITKTLHGKADNTFLWASLVCAELQKVSAIKAKKVLDILPSGLTNLYSRLIGQALKEQEDDDLRNLLVSVLFAVRPVTLSELAVMASLPQEYWGDPKSVQEYLEPCISIFSIQKEVVHFVHLSAKDYLLSSDILGLSADGAEEHEMLVISCFKYVYDFETCVLEEKSERKRLVQSCGLKRKHQDNQYSASDIESDSSTYSYLNEYEYFEHNWSSEARGMVEYPVLFWTAHARLATPDFMAKLDQKEDFFAPNSRILRNWLRRYRYGPARGVSELLPRNFSALHLAGCTGILSLATYLLQQPPVALNWIDSRGRTPLHWASMKGHVAVAELLIEGGAHIDITSFKEQAALRGEAAYEQIEASVEIEKGRCRTLVNLQDDDGKTALHYAVTFEHVKIVQLLLKNGGDILIRDSLGLMPWYYAQSVTFHASTIELSLLEALPTSSDGGNLIKKLYLAVVHHHESEVLRLLKLGADINASFLGLHMPLHRAVECDDEAMVKLLLHNGADVNARNDWGETPVHLAVLRGKKHMVDLLLRYQPDLHLVDDSGETALDRAILLEYKDIEELLRKAMDAQNPTEPTMNLPDQTSHIGNKHPINEQRRRTGVREWRLKMRL